MDDERGQATILVLGLLLAVVAGALVLGGVARGLGVGGERQRAADLAALAAAKALHGRYGGLFEPAVVAGLVRDVAADRRKRRDAVARLVLEPEAVAVRGDVVVVREVEVDALAGHVVVAVVVT